MKIIFSKIAVIVLALLFSSSGFSESSGSNLVYFQFSNNKVDVNSNLPSCTVDILVSCKATIEHGFEIINSDFFKKNIKHNKIKEITILFNPTEYRLTKTYFINWNNGVRLILQGKKYGNNSTVFTGSELLNFSSPSFDSPELKTIPVNIRHNIRMANISSVLSIKESGFSKPILPIQGELFWQSKPQKLAQWPNYGFSTIDSFYTQNKNIFKLKNFDFKEIEAANLQAQGYWFWDWANQSYQINYLGNGEFSIKNGNIQYGTKDGQRVLLKNSISFLDSPGEWYVDISDKKLYFWLPDDRVNQAEWSIVDTLLKIKSSSNIQVKDIIFNRTRGDAIVVNNSSSIVFDNIDIQYTGNRGIVINGGKNSGVIYSHIEYTGEGGILINGGNRNNLEPANNFVKNTVFNNYDRLVPTYRPAISLNGVGQIAKGNTITQGAHAAIIFTGNDHIISGNKISKVALETSDVGAIYTGRDYTARGTIIENNTIENIQPFRKDGSVIGVYLDDQASGITIKNNKFINVQKGVLLGGGRDNKIIYNIFNNNNIAISYDARGVTWQKDKTLDENWQLKKGLKIVPYNSAIWKSKYPNLSNILNDNYGQPKYNKIIGNTFIKSKPLVFSGITREKSGAQIDN